MRRPDGVPVYTYAREPGRPPIAVARVEGGAHAEHPWRTQTPHVHDFLVLAYVERGAGELRVDGRSWPVESGDAFVVAPGEVVAPEWAGDLTRASAWNVYFPADVLDGRGSGAPGSWRSHPLLFPFVGDRAGGTQRVRVPEVDRAGWVAHLAALDRELAELRPGAEDAARALLTLLLVDLARLAVADVPEHLRLQGEPTLAAVFDVIERRFAEAISLRDVADAVGLTPGHLTTVVGRRTGRTVQQWITERRLSEARRLLAETDLTVQAVAGRVGYRDAGYLTRRFRAAHGATPQEWRRAARS